MAEADFEKTSLEFNKLQNDLSGLLSSRQQLETQFQENDIVRKEFETLEDDAKIYKLTGPVLLPQDKAEAALNVDKRIEFIKKEMYVLLSSHPEVKTNKSRSERAEANIKTTQIKLEETGNILIQIRTAAQA